MRNEKLQNLCEGNFSRARGATRSGADGVATYSDTRLEVGNEEICKIVPHKGGEKLCQETIKRARYIATT